MRSLFRVPENEELADIPGLEYRRAYVMEDEERQLISAIDAEPWDTSLDRRRQTYGASYGRGAEPQPIPRWADFLRERLRSAGLGEFDQMLVNEYLPGQGIALHRDYEPFDRTVVSLSLLSDCVMDFRRLADQKKVSLLLERRSLLVLSDAARYEWEHGIARRKSDRWQGAVIARRKRVSVTFRRLKSPHWAQ